MNQVADFWRILEMEPTTDIQQIKQAYAVLAKKYHPEQYPEEFLKLRQAYEAALAFASGQVDAQAYMIQEEIPSKKSSSLQERNTQLEDVETTQEDIEDFDVFEVFDSKKNKGWDFSKLTEQKEIDDSAAMAQFLNLYCDKKSKDAKAWYLYFTSDEFLAVWREERFTEHLLEAVYKNAEDTPPNKTFAKCLNAVYGCYIQNTYLGEVAVFQQTSRFDGFLNIEKILNIHESPQKLAALRGNDYAMYLSFCEYNVLLYFFQENQWNDISKNKVENIFQRYDMVYIKERCEKKEYNETERHPLALRLIVYFIKHYDLPEDIYYYVWKKFSLESAIHGRSKLYYDEIREFLLAKNMHQKTEMYDFKEAYRKYDAYQKSFQNGSLDRQTIQDFFALKNTEYLLQDRKFLDTTLGYWLALSQDIYFVDELYDFYTQHSHVAQAKKILSRIKRRKAELVRENELKEDEQDQDFAKLSVQHRPFFRYWLNSGFYRAYDFSDILQYNIPFSNVWAAAFAKERPRWTGFVYKNKAVTIRFHRRYAEYFWGQQAVYQPFLQWSSIENLEDDTAFFLLLPVVFPFIDHWEMYHTVLCNIKTRLQHTALSEEIQNQLAAGMITMLFCGKLLIDEIGEGAEQNGYDCNALEIYAENDIAVYTCQWSQFHKTLYFYEQKDYNRIQSSVYENIETKGKAVSLAKRLLHAQTAQSVADISNLKILPLRMYVQPKAEKQEILEGEALTKEKIKAALHAFAENRLQRLELQWSKEEVVLVCDGKQYVCMCFHDAKYQMNTLLYHPEAYRTVDSQYVVYKPFLFGALPDYVIFHESKMLIRTFCQILFQFGTGEVPYHFVDGEYVWSYNVYLYGKYDAYLVDKIKYGAFPPERVITEYNIRRKFIIPKFPASMEQVNVNGERLQIKITPHSKNQVQTALQMYMQNSIKKLHLCWKIQENDDIYDTHIFLLQENKEYALFYLNDKTKSAHCLISDFSEYVKLEGQAPILHFCGIARHSYHIHKDLIRLRFFLILLLDSIEKPDMILNQKGAFSDGTKVYQKNVTYEELYHKLMDI